MPKIRGNKYLKPLYPQMLSKQGYKVNEADVNDQFHPVIYDREFVIGKLQHVFQHFKKPSELDELLEVIQEVIHEKKNQFKPARVQSR